jgi:hypothetical protein
MSEPYDNPFWEKRYEPKKKSKNIKIPKIVAYLSCFAGRTHFALTNLKFSLFIESGMLAWVSGEDTKES